MNKRKKVENGLNRLFSARNPEGETDEKDAAPGEQSTDAKESAPSRAKKDTEDKIKAVTGSLAGKKPKTSPRKPRRKADSQEPKPESPKTPEEETDHFEPPQPEKIAAVLQDHDQQPDPLSEADYTVEDKTAETDAAADQESPSTEQTTEPVDGAETGAIPEPAATPTFDSEQIVIFSLGEELYGINISAVEGIIKMQPITIVPRAPHYIEGVTNLRGVVVPVINLHKRLNLTLTEETLDSRIVNVRINNIAAGMIVDSVHSVIQVDGKDISMPSKMVSGDEVAFTRAIAKVDDRLVILLDLDKVLTVRISAKKFY